MPKPSAKEDMIAETLRARITGAQLAPGSQLPTYELLEREFSASRMTMHKAITRLKDEGFLTGIERKGVFVAERPPHLNRIAVLLAAPGRVSRFNRCIEYSAKDFAGATGRELIVLEALNNPFFRQEEADRLKAEIASRMLAGLLVCFDPDGCPDEGVFDHSAPKIYMSPGAKYKNPMLSLDSSSFARKAVEWLRDSGARKIALLCYPQESNAFHEALRLLDSYGLASRPEWQIPIGNAEIAEPIARLLLAAEKERRPDGILILDDHLTEHVARGVVAERAKVPSELKIISHCNWTMPPACPFPIKLLGYDSDRIVGLAVEAIDALNAGAAIPEKLTVNAVFEEERNEKANSPRRRIA